MTSLEKIFKKCEEYNIFPNLDETFCYTPKRITKYSSKYIGSIYSKTDINEIAECISEEGSCMLSYVIESKENKEVKITNIFISLLIEYGFDPYVNDNNIINIIITDKDILSEDSEDYDEEFEYEDVEYENEDEDVENDKDEEDVENDKDEEDVENDKDEEDVENDKNEEEIENDKDEEDVENDKDEEIENDKDEEEIGNDKNEEEIENDKDEEDVENDKDEEDVENDKDEEIENDKDEEIENDKNEEIENDKDEEENIQDTFEKLKYISTMTKPQLLNLLLDNRIYEYKSKNIRKINKTDLQDCARENIGNIKKI
jgi:hypothetical protein